MLDEMRYQSAVSCSLHPLPVASARTDDGRAAICRQSFGVVWLLLVAPVLSAVGESQAMADGGAAKSTSAAGETPSFDQVIGPLFGVSWFGGPVQIDVDLLRERSLRYLFPDISTQAHLEHTVRLVASGRVRLKPTITHVLSGIDSVPQAFEITSNKGQFKAINPAQVMMRA